MLILTLGQYYQEPISSKHINECKTILKISWEYIL